MAIYELFEKEEEIFEEVKSVVKEESKSHLFSTLVTRFCFLLLLIADLGWFIYNAAMVGVFALLYLVSIKRSSVFKRLLFKFALNLRRSAVCGLSLLVGLFSPPFGIMVACTYFLMYDKAGMDEVVPAPLQEQFKGIFKE